MLYCSVMAIFFIASGVLVNLFAFGHNFHVTLSENKNASISNETYFKNFTFSWSNGSNIILNTNGTASLKTQQVDCFGLGATVARTLQWFFSKNANDSNVLDVRFFLSSRKQPRRVEVLVGKQFGLEWVDFQIERRTVFIVHGFLSHGNETWIRKMEEAFLLWGDVNVVVVDWSAGSNSWNYYKAAINTRIVGNQISRFLSQLMNATIDARGSDVHNWGPLHLVGHSLGAHICSFAANKFKEAQSKWIVKRITGLDPAQPCFREVDLSMQLDKSDALFVDVIHTNGRLLSNLGLGLPEPIGHVDFYPNGGMKQPGCIMAQSLFFNYLPISKSKIQQTICSHGRSYLYLTESLISSALSNCTFWAHNWDLTYRRAMQIVNQPCNESVCSEMGIKAENYLHRGTFYVITAATVPFCVGDSASANDIREHLFDDLSTEWKD